MTGLSRRCRWHSNRDRGASSRSRVRPVFSWSSNVPCDSKLHIGSEGSLTLIDMVSKQLTSQGGADLSFAGEALDQAFEAHRAADDVALGDVALHFGQRFEDLVLLDSFGNDLAA